MLIAGSLLVLALLTAAIVGTKRMVHTDSANRAHTLDDDES